MGLGLGVAADIPRKAGKPLARGDLFAAIRKGIEDSFTDPFLAELLEITEDGHDLLVGLHPAAEPVLFTWDPAGKLTASAKTSTTGPGYHAYVVDVLRAVGQRCGLAWDWSDDDTGYATSGDFGALQRQMAEHLSALAESLLQNHDKTGCLIVNMGFGFAPPLDEPWSITVLGPRDKAWWERADAARDNAMAREFYIWWGRERDAPYYHKLGLALLWTEVRWRPPLDEAEERTASLALDCFERARELDPQIDIPETEVAELQRILESDPEAGEPTPEPPTGRIGYSRATVKRELPGGWTIHLPGYWYQEFDDESKRLNIWYNERTVGSATFALDPDPNGRPLSADQIAQLNDESLPTSAERFELREAGLMVRGCIIPAESEEEAAFTVVAIVGAEGCGAEVLICYDDPDHREWALSTLRTVRPPPADRPKE